MHSYLRVTKNSKSYIRKSKKGYLNFWIYKKIHAEVKLGYVFYLNAFLLSLTLIYTVTAVGFGWIKALRLPIAICNLLLCAVQIPAAVFSEIYNNLEEYGKRLVLLTKRRYGSGLHSSLLLIAEITMLLAFAIYNITLAV